MPYKIQKSYRKPGHDYKLNNGYFITICTKDKVHYFSRVENYKIILSPIGEIVRDEWLKTPKIRKNVILDNWIIMPNHFHGIIILEDRGQSAFHDYLVGTGRCPVLDGKTTERDRTGQRPDNNKRTGQRPVPTVYKSKFGHVKSGSISTIIGSFKSKVSKVVHQKYPNTNFAWQIRFYDRIIRDEEELHNIQNYIYTNPLNWNRDRNNLENLLM